MIRADTGKHGRFLSAPRFALFRFWRDDEGAAAAEFAMIAPLLAAMVVMTSDLGMGVYYKMQVEDAAQAGVQYTIMHGFDSSGIANAITNATSNSGISASPAPTQFCGCATSTGITTTDCTATCPNGNAAGNYVTVSAQGTYTTMVDYTIVSSSFAFTAQSTARLK